MVDLNNIKPRYNRVLIIDGSYALHRNLHVPNLFELENSKHVHTGGIYGTLKLLSSEIRNCGTYFPIVTFDQGQAPRRLNADPDYKNHQQRMLTENVILTPEEAYNDYVTEYRKQRNKLMEILPLFGIPCLKFKDWEGDDLMYILSKMSYNGMVLTDDRDMLQLLSENCTVRRPMANEHWTLEKFLGDKEFNEIHDFIIYKAVVGDNSDNIPGSCKGIGEKSINEFIKLLNCFSRNNPEGLSMSQYPKTEQDMKEFCNSRDIKYKKAYLNFDLNRFKTNIELVDLNKVEVPEEIYESIVATIENSRSLTNYFKAAQILGELEIKEFGIDELMQAVSYRYQNLFI